MMTPETFDRVARELMAEADQLFQQDAHGTAEAAARAVIVNVFLAGMNRFAWWKDGVQMVGTCGTTYKKAVEDVLVEAGI